MSSDYLIFMLVQIIFQSYKKLLILIQIKENLLYLTMVKEFEILFTFWMLVKFIN